MTSNEFKGEKSDTNGPSKMSLSLVISTKPSHFYVPQFCRLFFHDFEPHPHVVPLPMPAGQGFGPADEILLSNLAEHVSVAVHNAEFYRAAIVTSERANVTWPKMNGCSSSSETYGKKTSSIFLRFFILVVMGVIPVYQDIHDRLLYKNGWRKRLRIGRIG